MAHLAHWVAPVVYLEMPERRISASKQVAQLRQRDREISIGDFKGVGHFKATF